ncbi:tetratricopeptide repeat protein [Pilimelia anulata]|nr:tetratricopeptide repeat protein [Pilimelia anulata]
MSGWFAVVLLGGGAAALLAAALPGLGGPAGGKPASVVGAVVGAVGLGLAVFALVARLRPEPARRLVRVEPPGIAWPHGAGIVPRAASCFRHRAVTDQLVRRIRQPLPRRAYVLHGAAGVGKTQVAAAVARRARDAGDVDLLVWINATTREGIVAGYAAAADDLTGAPGHDADRSAARLLAWLDATDRRWLVILDDLTDPADLRGLWPPGHRHGDVLVTTRVRRPELLRGRVDVPLGVFEAEEATGYVLDRLGLGFAERGEAAALAAELDRLPLALSHATAYISDNELTCAEYRRLRAERPPGDDPGATVATTARLGLAGADRSLASGLAGPVVALLSMYDPSGVPTCVLTGEPALAYLAAARPAPARAADPAVAPAAVARAIACLRRYQLAGHYAAGLYGGRPVHLVKTHGLVQRLVRQDLTPGERVAAARAAAAALLAAWPDGEDGAAGRVLRTHALALLTRAGDALWAGHRVPPVLLRCGRSLGAAGLTVAAAAYWEGLAATAARLLGADHRGTLAVRGHLAWSRLGGAGPDRIGRATAELARLLADRTRLLGAGHRDTLLTRHHLAYCRGLGGDAAGAAEEFRAVLADRQRALGDTHPDTLTTRHQLGRWLGRADRPDEAVAHLATVLGQRHRILGRDHPETLLSAANLAWWRGARGDLVAASQAYGGVVADFERVLGPTHPRTLRGRGNLAYLRHGTGYPGAADDLRALVADLVRVLGADHPDTAATRRALACVTGRRGSCPAYPTPLYDPAAGLSPPDDEPPPTPSS